MTARVLVVDDILANVKLLEARLQAEYIEVLTAFSGPEALDVCARERVDVILLDVMMPGMDGFEACRRLKSDPATQDVPVIMVTALDQPSDRLQGLVGEVLLRPNVQVCLLAGRGKGNPRTPGREIPVGPRCEFYAVFLLPPGGSNH